MGGGPKCGFLIIEQSLRPTNTLIECDKSNWSIIKDKADKEHKGRLVQTTFLSEWQGGTVQDMTCKRCL